MIMECIDYLFIFTIFNLVIYDFIVYMDAQLMIVAFNFHPNIHLVFTIVLLYKCIQYY